MLLGFRMDKLTFVYLLRSWKSKSERVNGTMLGK